MDLFTGYHTAFSFVALSGVLGILLWTPYVVARMVVWGLPTFLNNYPAGFPAKQPEQPLWAARAQRAHLNLLETLPAFLAVVLAASVLAPAAGPVVGMWAAVFFWARVVHAVVYTLGVPYVRTPVYLASWAAVLVIGAQALIS